MKTNILNYNGSLANRTTAAQERQRIETLANQGEQVTLDYAGVVSLSGSYADELFGVYALRHGIEGLKATIKIKGASTTVARAIGQAIQNRMTPSAA